MRVAESAGRAFAKSTGPSRSPSISSFVAKSACNHPPDTVKLKRRELAKIKMVCLIIKPNSIMMLDIET